jgi:hypothetical protein
MGAEMVGEDECTEYFIVEYAFCNEYMMWHKTEIFYPILTDTAFVHNLN